MTKMALVIVVLLFIHGVAIKRIAADDSFPEREVLVHKYKTDKFHNVVKKICNPSTQMIPDTELKHSDIYFRLTSPTWIVKDRKLIKNASISGGPYAFLTVPQAGYGRSLYGIYSDLGYDAEAILRQRDQPMVALAFRYKEEIQFSRVRDGGGELKRDHFYRHVYIPTWDNAFALFARLADPNFNDPKNPMPLDFGNNKSDRQLARFFPAERRKHIAQLPYALLRAAGGPDWTYRNLLERKMSMNSHFRGVGITENTLSPADNRKGLPEYVGPNRYFTDLEEFAVIDMGKMKFVEVHD